MRWRLVCRRISVLLGFLEPRNATEVGRAEARPYKLGGTNRLMRRRSPRPTAEAFQFRLQLANTFLEFGQAIQGGDGF
jgi:hypothetical protein